MRPAWLNGLQKAERVSRDRRVHSDRDPSRQSGRRGRGSPGPARVPETAVLGGPYDVIARAQAPSVDELARLVTSRIQALDGVRRTTTSPVVYL